MSNTQEIYFLNAVAFKVQLKVRIMIAEQSQHQQSHCLGYCFFGAFSSTVVNNCQYCATVAISIFSSGE